MTKRLFILILVAALSRPVNADAGGSAYKHAIRAERTSDYDSAYQYLKRACTLSPDNPRYTIAFTKIRSAASNQHLHSGELLRNNGSLNEALAEFKRAVEIDASSFIAQQEVRRTTDMILRRERKNAEPPAKPAVPLEDELAEPVELHPLSNAPITMHMTANADVAYRTIGRLAGINVLMDPDLRPPKITIDLTDVTLRDALDMVRLESKTFWRPVLANAIFVTTDSQSKRKELEPNVMQTFHLQNITTPAELQDAANVMRQMLDITHVQLLAAQSALMVRGTPDQLRLAEKLLTDIDKPRPEVLVDITVMEISRERLRKLGANVPTSASIGYTGGASKNSSGSGGSGGGGGGGYTATIGDFSISVPGATFTALTSDSHAKVLQNPEIRVLNDEKAVLRIGDRVPVATGSYSTGVVGAGSVNPLIGTQFTYLDVGVNVDITPHIHANRDVTLKMSLEISSVTGSTDIGGISEPTIGQRRIEHEARLADGEVNLLGGILEDSETQSMSGLPWVSKIPILKYFFAQDDRQRQENEIVFAITPHIVRAQEVSDEKSRFIEIGTGNTIELRRKQTTAPSPATEHPADGAKAQRDSSKAEGPRAHATIPPVAATPASR